MKSPMICHRFATTDNRLSLMGRLVFNPQKSTGYLSKIKKKKKKSRGQFSLIDDYLQLLFTGSPNLKNKTKQNCSTNLDQKLLGLFFLIKSNFFFFFLSLLMIPNTPPVF